MPETRLVSECVQEGLLISFCLGWEVLKCGLLWSRYYIGKFSIKEKGCGLTRDSKSVPLEHLLLYDWTVQLFFNSKYYIYYIIFTYVWTSSSSRARCRSCPSCRCCYYFSFSSYSSSSLSVSSPSRPRFSETGCPFFWCGSRPCRRWWCGRRIVVSPPLCISFVSRTPSVGRTSNLSPSEGFVPRNSDEFFKNVIGTCHSQNKRYREIFVIVKE